MKISFIIFFYTRSSKITGKLKKYSPDFNWAFLFVNVQTFMYVYPNMHIINKIFIYYHRNERYFVIGYSISIALWNQHKSVSLNIFINAVVISKYLMIAGIYFSFLLLQLLFSDFFF